MSAKFGGGGNKCTKCDTTAYPAETIQHEKMPYHADCFRCNTCDKKMENATKASAFDGQIYCEQCFKKGGFSQKQKDVKWTKKEGGDATTSKFGGGGTSCTICAKTVYPAETVSYEKQPYHVECFACSVCKKKMTASSAAKFEDAIFCTKCFQDGGYTRKQTATAKTGGGGGGGNYSSKFGGGGNKCTICDKTVYAAETVSYEKLPYHAECFKCSECSKKMQAAGAAKFEDAIFCTKCFSDGGYARKQTATAKVGGGGGGGAATNSKFGGGGSKCYACEKTVYAAETIQYEKKPFHDACFKCKNCAKKVNPSGAEAKKTGDEIEVYCSKCWKDLGLNRAKLDAGGAGAEAAEEPAAAEEAAEEAAEAAAEEPAAEEPAAEEAAE